MLVNPLAEPLDEPLAEPLATPFFGLVCAEKGSVRAAIKEVMAEVAKKTGPRLLLGAILRTQRGQAGLEIFDLGADSDRQPFIDPVADGRRNIGRKHLGGLAVEAA